MMSYANKQYPYYYNCSEEYPDQPRGRTSPLTANANAQQQFQPMHFTSYPPYSPYSPSGYTSSNPATNSASFSRLRPAKKKVTFKPTCTVRTHAARGITKDEKSKTYYSKDQLKLMVLEANAICTLSQELPDIRNSGTLLTMEERRDSMLGLEDDNDCHGSGEALDSLRGLELVMFPKRKQNKLLAQKSLLKYQTFLNSKQPNVGVERKHMALAAASAKLNRWSSLVAMETARLDALRAFDGDYLIPIDITKQPMDVVSPFSFFKKRPRRQERNSNRRRGSRRVTPTPISIPKEENDGDDSIIADQQMHFKRRKLG